MVCTRNLRQHYLNLATNVSGLYICRVVIARQKKALDSMQPSKSFESVLCSKSETIMFQQKGKIVVTNTVREAVFHVC